MCHRLAETDWHTNRVDFKGPRLIFHKDRDLIKFFGNLRIIIWLACEPYKMNQYQKKEYNQHSTLFKELIPNQDLLRQTLNSTNFYLSIFPAKKQ